MKPLTLRLQPPRPSLLHLCLLAIPLSVGIAMNAGAQTPAAGATAPATPKADAKPAPAKPAAKGKSGTGGAAGTTTPTPAKAELVPDKDTAATTPPASASPMAELKKSNDQLDKLLKKKYPNWSPEAEAQKADVRKLVGGFLDYRELAHRAVVNHWDALSAALRTVLGTTLRDLVERSYL